MKRLLLFVMILVFNAALFGCSGEADKSRMQSQEQYEKPESEQTGAISQKNNQQAVKQQESLQKKDEQQSGEMPQAAETDGNEGSVYYKNTKYGFTFSLPDSWNGYSVLTGKWEGYSEEKPEGEQISEATGPIISIRHPEWTDKNPRQDILIMIFTSEQWQKLQQDKFHIGAAPIGPTEIGRNSRYIFALPARYNYAFPTGYEEVEDILKSKPLSADND